jgi:hypothetical protein
VWRELRQLSLGAYTDRCSILKKARDVSNWVKLRVLHNLPVEGSSLDRKKDDDATPSPATMNKEE